MSTDLHPTTEQADPKPSLPSGGDAGSSLGRVLLILVLLAALVFTGSLMAKRLFATKKKERLTHTVSRGDLTVSVIEQGTLESSNNTEITCRVGGWNTVTWVIPGGSVVEPIKRLMRRFPRWLP